MHEEPVITNRINLILQNGYTLVDNNISSRWRKKLKRILLRDLGMGFRMIKLDHGFYRIERTFNDLR